MDNPLGSTTTEEIKEALEDNPATAAAKIQEYLDKAKNTPLNIAITGESGSGKSTFVNAFRGIGDMDEGASPTGCLETTMEVKDYPHPNYPNVILWDLPGIGTTNFPADKYLQHVGFEGFDFFIIISDTRFTENDVKLALEIQKMGKKFYFVRSKIDNDLRAEERSKEVDAEKTLARIRENCIQGLQNKGIESPQVFLLSSFDRHLHDLPLLHETLEKELPEHKRDVLLFAVSNISLEIINEKKKAFKRQTEYYATLSAVGAAVPVPGLSVTLDLSVLVAAVTQFVVGFGLDSGSLQRLANSTRVPLEDLKAVIKSPLALQKITTDLILNLLSQYAATATLVAAEEGAKFIPIFGIPAAMILSFMTTYRALSTFLNKLAEDAQSVFERSVGFTTSV
ncbi:interferon-inducible GTPase 5-like [Symphorus nematophorus]